MIKLIPDWKKSWKFSSMWYSVGGVLVGIADIVLQTVPIGQIHAIPHGKSVMLVLLGLTVIGRITKMKGNSDEREETK